jgi:hypothetical protein
MIQRDTRDHTLYVFSDDLVDLRLAGGTRSPIHLPRQARRNRVTHHPLEIGRQPIRKRKTLVHHPIGGQLPASLLHHRQRDVLATPRKIVVQEVTGDIRS